MTRFPSQQEIDAMTVTFESYFLSLGKVAHEWNHMQEELGGLFCDVTGLGERMGMSIWHALKSDRSQRDLLRAAVDIKASDEDWFEERPKAQPAIVDVMNEINEFSNRRNAAIHAPCSVVSADGDSEVIALSFTGNPNAAKLRNKDILSEFEWYERTADHYRRYVKDVRYALSEPRVPWPDKPARPSRGQKSVPLNHSRP